MGYVITIALLIVSYINTSNSTEISYIDQNNIIGGNSSLYYNSCGDSKYGGGSASCPNNKSPNPCTEGIHEICNDDNSTFWCGTPNSCDTCRRNKAFKCRSYRGKWYPLFGNCYRSGTHVATTVNCQANDGNYHSYTCK